MASKGERKETWPPLVSLFLLPLSMAGTVLAGAFIGSFAAAACLAVFAVCGYVVDGEVHRYGALMRREVRTTTQLTRDFLQFESARVGLPAWLLWLPLYVIWGSMAVGVLAMPFL